MIAGQSSLASNLGGNRSYKQYDSSSSGLKHGLINSNPFKNSTSTLKSNSLNSSQLGDNKSTIVSNGLDSGRSSSKFNLGGNNNSYGNSNIKSTRDGLGNFRPSNSDRSDALPNNNSYNTEIESIRSLKDTNSSSYLTDFANSGSNSENIKPALNKDQLKDLKNNAGKPESYKLKQTSASNKLNNIENTSNLNLDDSAFSKNGQLLESSMEKIKFDYSNKQLKDVFLDENDQNVIKLEISKFDPQEMKLEDFIYEAIKSNLDLKISEKASEQAGWNFWRQLAETMPELSLNAGIRNLDGTFFFNRNLQGPINEKQSYASLFLNWRAFNGGKNILLALAQNHLSKAKDASALNQYNLTILNAVNLYNQLLLAQSTLDTVDKAFLETETNLNLTKTNYEIGTGTYYDFLQAKARNYAAKQILLTEQSNFRKAQIAIAEFLNLDYENQFYIEAKEMPLLNIYDANHKYEDIITDSHLNNPQLAEAVMMEKASRRQLLASYGEFLPKLDFYLNMEGLGADFGDLNNVTTVGGQLSLELGKGIGFGHFTNLKINKNALEIAKLTNQKTKLAVEKSVRSAYLNLETARSNIEQAKQRLLSTKEALRISKLRFKNGIEIINDLVQNETVYSEARQNMLSSVTQFNNAQIRLAYLSGSIDLEKMLTRDEPAEAELDVLSLVD
jgi:outer membrane protein TolC